MIDNKVLTAILMATTLTACGGGAEQTTKEATVEIADIIENNFEEGALLDEGVRILPENEVTAKATYKGIVGLDETETLSTVGKITVLVDIPNDIVSGSATDFVLLKGFDDEDFDSSNLETVDTYTGTLDISNGSVIDLPNETEIPGASSTFAALIADFDGTLVAASDGSEYVVDSEVVGGFFEGSSDKNLLVGNVEGTITGPDGVVTISDLDSGIILAYEQ